VRSQNLLMDCTDSTDWNWHLDTPERGGSLSKSPLFDPISGFGGNGKKIDPNPAHFPGTGGGCIFNGPFANHTLRIGPRALMKVNNTRCLTRDFHPQDFESSASRKMVAQALKSKTFVDLQANLERPPFDKAEWGLHAIGHSGVGGEVHLPGINAFMNTHRFGRCLMPLVQ
jgi:tyrosinase